MQTQMKAWEQVGELFETLGKHLRSRAEDVGAEANAERAAIEKSIRTVTTALEDLLASLGKAVRDPQVRKDVTRLVESLRTAVQQTYTSATTRARRVVEPAHRTAVRKPAATRTTRAPEQNRPAKAAPKAHATVKPRKATSGKPA